MEESTSREKVLKKIRSALLSKTDPPYASLDSESPVFPEFEDSLDIVFAQEFTRTGGKFIYCENEPEFRKNLQLVKTERKWKNLYCIEPELKGLLDHFGIPTLDDLQDLQFNEAGITSCEFLIARTGSILVSSRQMGGRRQHAFPEVHLVVAKTSQIVAEIKDGLLLLREKYQPIMPSLISLITGPSRTADIEKTLVMGAHGPKELFLFLVDEVS